MEVAGHGVLRSRKISKRSLSSRLRGPHVVKRPVDADLTVTDAEDSPRRLYRRQVSRSPTMNRIPELTRTLTFRRFRSLAMGSQGYGVSGCFKMAGIEERSGATNEVRTNR
jgi:hypothetical protein